MAGGSLAIDAPGPANETMCADLGCPQCAASHQVLWAGGIENIWMTALLFGVVVLFTLIWECATVRARPGWLSAPSVFLCKSILYGAFVRARRALNGRKRRFPARAGATGACGVGSQRLQGSLGKGV